MDCDESFDISFEEDMECMDMIPDTGSDRSAVQHQCSKIGKYIRRIHKWAYLMCLKRKIVKFAVKK